MGLSFAGMLSPNPAYYKIQGRAAEIARAMGSDLAGAEHLFLGMLHDNSWPVRAIAGLVDAEAAEAAVLAAMRAPDYSAPVHPAGPHFRADVELWGGKTAHELGDSYVGVEHAFLEIIRNQGTIPARALSTLASLNDIADTVLAVKNAPPNAPASAAFLPEGGELDEDLRQAIRAHLPEGTTFGFNWLNGRPWINVMDPDASSSSGAARSRSVLNAALASLGRARP